MKKNVVLLFMIFVLLAGCSKGKAEDQIPKFLNVDLQITPIPAKVNESITFQAKATYGNETVNNADDVSFEIWRADSKKTQKYPVKRSKNGVYQFKKAFTKEGTYYVYAHVTAEGMHTMPKKEFVIGTPSKK